eukprot:gene31707-6912_t
MVSSDPPTPEHPSAHKNPFKFGFHRKKGESGSEAEASGTDVQDPDCDELQLIEHYRPERTSAHKNGFKLRFHRNKGEPGSEVEGSSTDVQDPDWNEQQPTEQNKPERTSAHKNGFKLRFHRKKGEPRSEVEGSSTDVQDPDCDEQQPTEQYRPEHTSTQKNPFKFGFLRKKGESGTEAEASGSDVQDPDWDVHQPTEQYMPAAQGVYHDMTLPLSHYFISSGHNSYLHGDQLKSHSGTETITKSLLLGCRVIELDIYNQTSKTSGPVCKHGGTLTRHVPVRECLVAIKEHAFTASKFPVIITIENHTNDENAILLAAMLREELGDLLFIPTAEELSKSEWLSPSQLSNKVVIRAKTHAIVDELKTLVYITNSKFKEFIFITFDGAGMKSCR